MKVAGLIYLLIAFLFFQPSQDLAQSAARWISQASVSTNGKWVAFEYQGNVFKVSVSGGDATQLTREKSLLNNWLLKRLSIYK